MEKEQRSKLQKATQDARRLLEDEFSRQLLETYDINVAAGRWNEEPGAHLQAEQRLLREKLLAWIEHRSAQINDEKEALLLALREMAFTALNRFVALKLMEARELVRPCVSGGLESEGFQEFTAVAQGLLVDQESSYRLYLETIFEDVSRELRALFDPRDPASLLWPKRTALLDLLDILNRSELAELWREDETLGWIYQYFNGDAERKKMREESSAPRNSRELAVRNQFFTPRYVVEFLTDNTLGRIWYEMRQGDTGLKESCHYLVRRPSEIWLQPGEEAPAEVVADEALSQEELLRQVVHIPYRLLKDPREIRMLDPACGSMHFGLYAFDLYLAIYEEAWEISQGSDEQAKQGEAFAPFVTYAADFASKAAFLREVPRLILQHNIHGVDIDPRATQIARLTLWLRAQRAWQEQGVEVAARPAISRSNVVCAEPMPGERELLSDFVDQQFPEAERGLVQQLLEAIFDRMQLAAEAGSLLKIEEEIRDAIDETQNKWQRLAVYQNQLFDFSDPDKSLRVGSSSERWLLNLSNDAWVNIEERIYRSLEKYSDKADSVDIFQRQLFAEDSARGFAFIDICRQRYDVVLMNPPFGTFSSHWKDQARHCYPLSSGDILCSFVERGIQLLQEDSLLGAITSRAPFYLGSSAKWREEILLGKACPTVFVDIGNGVMDGAMVESASYVIQKSQAKLKSENALFIKVSDTALSRSSSLAIQISEEVRSTNSRSWIRPSEFALIPGSPFAYWVGESVRSTYRRMPSLFHRGFHPRMGLTTNSDFRFLRLNWEASNLSNSFKPFAKGGAYSPFYSDIHLTILWNGSGKELKAFALTTPGTTHWSRNIRSPDFYFRPGITWSRRSQRGLSMRPLPAGCIFSDKGPTLFVDHDSEEDLGSLLAIMNSSSFKGLVSLQISFGSYEVGVIQATPSPDFSVCASGLSDRAIRLFELKRKMVRNNETSLAFCVPEILDFNDGSISQASRYWEKSNASAEDECERITKEIDELVSCLYGFSDGELRSLVMLGTTEQAVSNDDEAEDNEEPVGDILRQQVFALISYFVGCCFGRWDIRYATGAISQPVLPGPFDAISLTAPGILAKQESGSDAGESIDQTLPDYPVRIAWEGILADSPGDSFDIYQCVLECLAAVWHDNAKGINCELVEILRLSSLRECFSSPNSFFPYHLRRYSKSRRQAPIYWQLSAGNGSYSAWLYYHSFTSDTLYRLLRDFVEPRIQEAEREQFELESHGGLLGDAASLLQEAQVLLQDLRLFKSELELVAPLWNPNLNDGVIINHAILWRITPYTPWQKKCKECLDKLVKGDYDWAHLAFHLWPERVIRKCTTDRSLAIAHGLEERLWQETSKGNWLQRQVSDAELQALLAEYSKPAVQNALERFLAAPPPVAAARTRAPRAGKSSSISTTRRPRGTAPEVDAETSRQTLLVLTAAPAEGLGRNAIAELLGVEAASLTPVIKQLKEGGQIEQLGAARGAKYRLSESGLAAVESQAGEGE